MMTFCVYAGCAAISYSLGGILKILLSRRFEIA